MSDDPLNAHHKALRLNLDNAKYGTFAEIGAGQEVARWFFRVGGASGTVAKTISAYDMTISDAIYGKAERYVSRQRLLEMLDHEYGLLLERLNEKRGATTAFFVFADTVVAQSYHRRAECDGWMGVRFQHQPRAESSDVIVHVRMLDKENLQQQQALGIIGVNLIYGALFLHADAGAFLRSLMDGLTNDRVEVDMVKLSGAAFPKVDNRLMSLQLVEHGLTDAAMFTADGEVVQASEMLYKKKVLVERGSFRPVTKVTEDMLVVAGRQFLADTGARRDDVLGLTEMTLRELGGEGGEIDYQDFLDRVDILGTLDKTVLISNYFEFHRLAAYLFRYTKERIGIVLGMPTLREVFEPKYYTDLEGGILESFGRMFKNNLRVYVYPLKEPATGKLITVENLRVQPRLQKLYDFLHENGAIVAARGYDESCLGIFPRDVLAKINARDPSWEQMVPPPVAKIIKKRKLLGYRAG